MVRSTAKHGAAAVIAQHCHSHLISADFYSSQGLVRSTAKYWVRMSDVSTVKHHILQVGRQSFARPCFFFCCRSALLLC